jgi:hypothetical protein
MRIWIVVLAGVLVSIAVFAADAVPGPKLVPPTVRLFEDHRYLVNHPSPDYWAISPYYVHQEKGAYCSVATAAMIVNAARVHEKLTAAAELATQEKLLDKLPAPRWRDSVNGKGHGVALDEFGPILSEILKAYGMGVEKIETVHVDADDAATRKKVHDLLVQNEKSDRDFIAVNFLQSEYTGDPEGKVGHLSPVAAYDPKTRRVLIMDPDRQYYEPYWVTEDAFIKGMQTLDNSMKTHRGLIYIKLK